MLGKLRRNFASFASLSWFMPAPLCLDSVGRLRTRCAKKEDFTFFAWAVYQQTEISQFLAWAVYQRPKWLLVDSVGRLPIATNLTPVFNATAWAV